MRREAPKVEDKTGQDRTRRERQSREDEGEERDRDASAFVESLKKNAIFKGEPYFRQGFLCDVL